MSLCQAGHTRHDTKRVEVDGMTFNVYDWEKYIQANYLFRARP